MTPFGIAQATGLPDSVIDSALQWLLLRRLAVCGSYKTPGRGGQTAWLIGEPMEAVWSAVDDEMPVAGAPGASFEQGHAGRVARRARWSARKMIGELTIISVPPGDVPASVQDAWVGLTVPVTARESKPCWAVPTGVLSRNPASCRSYSIDARRCIAQLREHAVVAAEWWVASFPQMVRMGRCVFPVDNCDYAHYE
jgi:hypothetical protein